jgi:hypothetical protein
MARQLDDYYFHDSRLVLVPIEHLGSAGMSPDFAACATARAGWEPSRIALFNAAFALYWSRSARLTAQLSSWPAPRLRHVAVVTKPETVRPYVQLLNTSAWLLYLTDLDPVESHAELAAYLLVLGDRMAVTGEVSSAPLCTAPYWFERSEDECAAFATAAAGCRRPDGDLLRTVAAALPWLRHLWHEELPPRPLARGYSPVPHTGLLVRREQEGLASTLLQASAAVAKGVVDGYHAAWSAPESRATRALCDWLVARRPELLICARGGRVVWQPEHPERVGAVRQELRTASGAAVRDIHADLAVVEARSRAFFEALVDREALPAPEAPMEQGGYVYLHSERRLIAYNLHEPGIERLQGPALPYARAMLGARTVHEWAHLAADAGWISQAVSTSGAADLTAKLAAELAETVAAAPPPLRAITRADIEALIAACAPAPSGGPWQAAGMALARLLVKRLPDYQANLLGERFMTLAERETYVRQNVRTLRSEYSPDRVWRMLVRYLYEYQYLRFSAVDDRRTFFVRSTWFDVDFLVSRILDEDRFDRLLSAVAAICDTYRVDEARFRTVAPPLDFGPAPS